MSNTTTSRRAPRIVFLGMQSNFSAPCLQALLESGVDVCAVVVPATQNSKLESPAINRRAQPGSTRSMLPVLNSSLHTNIVQLAMERKIPVWEVRRISDPATVETIAAYFPDMICVACFSLRIPRIILALPRLGCLNVHPSLLPGNRGPDPLFWTFREGSRQTGVTIHYIDEGMDTGDMLAQEIIEVPDGISYTQLESLCAVRGGELLARTVRDVYNGSVVHKPQDETKSHYHIMPASEDYVVPVAEWSARHVYNFICGLAGGNEPIKLLVGKKNFSVASAVSYSQENISDNPNEGYCWRGKGLWVRCKVGWVEVTGLCS